MAISSSQLAAAVWLLAFLYGLLWVVWEFYKVYQQKRDSKDDKPSTNGSLAEITFLNNQLHEENLMLESHLDAIEELQQQVGLASPAEAQRLQKEITAKEEVAALLLKQYRLLKDRLENNSIPHASAVKTQKKSLLPLSFQEATSRWLIFIFLWTGILVALVSVVKHTTADKIVSAPSAPAATTASASTSDPHRQEALLRIKERLSKDPNDIEALSELAHMLLRSQMLSEAQAINNRVLALQGNHLEALVHQAVLKAGANHAAEALAELSRIVADHPDMAEAWFFRGMLSMQAGDHLTMKESFQHYLDVAAEGPQKERVKSILGGVP